MRKFKTVMKYLMAVFYIATGINHFRNPAFYVSIMPPYIPWHLAMVYISGVIELVLGVMVLIPKYRTLAAWGIIALLIAVYPANIHMAMNPHLYPQYSPILLRYVRLPFQIVFIALAYWFTKPDAPAAVNA